jgi:hypothetical protein
MIILVHQDGLKIFLLVAVTVEILRVISIHEHVEAIKESVGLTTHLRRCVLLVGRCQLPNLYRASPFYLSYRVYGFNEKLM